MSIAVNLADRSFVHAITGSSPLINPTPKQGTITPQTGTNLTIPEAPESTSSYIATTRYNADRFYRVVIDTGASQKSTAGYDQFLAYGKIYPKTIDTTRAGQVKVQFGIGATSSIGSVTIKTPIGNVEFHIVQADTPFLLCLAVMNTLKVYYNNITNTLVTPAGPIPVIQFLWEECMEPFITESFTENPFLLTATELSRLHRRFGYPAANRLHKLLERAGHEDVHKDRNGYRFTTTYSLRIRRFCNDQNHGLDMFLNF